MHRLHVLLALVCLPVALAAGQDGKVLRLRLVDQPPIIDGRIDPVWSAADSATDFFQLQPFYGKSPDVRTTVSVLTTREALYCLIVGYDKRENIQRTTGKLDDFGGDICSIMLDTFGDKKTAYKFAVSASGVKADSRMLDDARNRDYSWDGVWFADAEIYEWGYVIEVEIPYWSIQYDETLSSWGLDFDRWVPWLNQDLYWCEYEENEGQRISKFGTLEFDEFKPTEKGSNLEVYPVGLTKATYLQSGNYKGDADAGLDIFYNPSPQLTFQLTANPDFAQIEADPFEFNISRFETYYNERRPFFTQGNEIFMPSGRERNTGFYRPLELFYSRRIGKILPGGSEVPLLLGTKAFGRIDDWEYGGFMAMTGETDYILDDSLRTEPQALFGSVRLKTQFQENSTIGLLFVGKKTRESDNGVLDIDGAFRGSTWQLSYQLASDFGTFGLPSLAGSFGFTNFQDNWMNLVRGRHIGSDFDVSQVGYVPWSGTSEVVAISGPRWYYEDGFIRSILLYGGGAVAYEKYDDYMDRILVFGYNMQFRANIGFEINLSGGRSRDGGLVSDPDSRLYNSYEATFSVWGNPSPDWQGNVWGGYSKTFNFNRDYLGYYGWTGASLSYQLLSTLQVGGNGNVYVEWDPNHVTEDVTINTRPYASWTPLNDLNIRLYVDMVYLQSSDKLEQTIAGLLFSYNFLPKSWIYFAFNEMRDRPERVDALGQPLPRDLRLANRAGVLKVKYLYYF